MDTYSHNTVCHCAGSLCINKYIFINLQKEGTINAEINKKRNDKAVFEEQPVIQKF